MLESVISSILGDPGAASRDDAIFSGERYFGRQFTSIQGRKSPWEPILTEPVPEMFEFFLLIGQKNIFFCQIGSGGPLHWLATDQANQRGKFENFWNWFDKNKFPGALSCLK